MNEIYVKRNNRIVPLNITPEMKEEIKTFKERLIDMRNRPDETSDFDVRTVDIIMNELDDCDRNLLIAFYSIADCSTGNLAKIMHCNYNTILIRIRKLIKKIQTLNDTPRTDNNKPRVNPCD